MHVLDLASGAEVSIGADEPVVLASVFKIFIALEFYAQAHAGLIDPMERVELTPGSLTAGPTGTSIFEDVASVSLRDLCGLMMSISDNAATDILLAKVGRERVNGRLETLGCTHTVVESDLADLFDEMAVEIGFRHYAELDAARAGDLGEAARRRSWDARLIDGSSAFDAKRTNRSTPREMTSLLRAIWNGSAASREACDAVRRAMSRQVSSRLGRRLPDGAAIAAKTGSLTGRIRNEVGVITHADGREFAVAVFTRARAPFVHVAEIEDQMGKGAAAAISALRQFA